MMRTISLLRFIPTFLVSAVPLSAQDLPNVLGDPPATSQEEWLEEQRPQIHQHFRDEVYGRSPVDRPESLSFRVLEEDPEAMDGAATLKIVKVSYEGPGGESGFQLILFIPNEVEKPAPGFVLICNRDREHIDPTREKKSDFWPAEMMVKRGYVAAAFHNSELSIDKPRDFDNGVHQVFDDFEGERPGNAWGTIAGWAWGASRALDYFESDPGVDATRIAVIGHSRGGKTALWAGANDPRFAMAISNNSGCTGAALARRKKGETVARINKVFPHWFCGNYKKYDDREEELPVDQHQLVALLAPRPVYVASASDDAWADPEGEFLAAWHAGPVYRLFGLEGLEDQTMPEPGGVRQGGHVGYHLREGKHNLTAWDWENYLDFADRHLKR